MNKLPMLIIASLLFLSCGKNAKKTDFQKSEIISKKYIEQGDAIINQRIKEGKVNVYVKKENLYVKISNNKWPDSIETTYNIIEDSNIKIFIEVPYSESGDWNNTHTYYYDSSGDLMAIKAVSSFFNSICYDGALTETTIKYFDKNHMLLSSTYSLVDDQKRPIRDSSKCVFNYRDSIPQYTVFGKIPLVEEIVR